MDLGIDPLGEGGFDISYQLPESRGPRIDQVDKWTRMAGACGRPGQGRCTRKIEMISDHHQIARPEFGPQGSGRIGDDERPASCCHRRSDRMGDLDGAVPLIEVETAEKGQHAQVTDLEGPDLGALMRHYRGRESGQYSQIVSGRDGTDAGGSVRQPGTEDHGNIVVTDPTQLSQPCRCQIGQLIGIDRSARRIIVGWGPCRDGHADIFAAFGGCGRVGAYHRDGD